MNRSGSHGDVGCSDPTDRTVWKTFQVSICVARTARVGWSGGRGEEICQQNPRRKTRVSLTWSKTRKMLRLTGALCAPVKGLYHFM